MTYHELLQAIAATVFLLLAGFVIGKVVSLLIRAPGWLWEGPIANFLQWREERRGRRSTAPAWDAPTLHTHPRYVICGATVRSRYDNDLHFVGGMQLIRLYVLAPGDCELWNQFIDYPRDTVFLFPRPDGEYARPLPSRFAPEKRGMTEEQIRQMAVVLGLPFDHHRRLRRDVLAALAGCS